MNTHLVIFEHYIPATPWNDYTDMWVTKYQRFTEEPVALQYLLTLKNEPEKFRNVELYKNVKIFLEIL